MTDVRPLMFGKLLPPPYAGVEAHIDLLLRALLPGIKGTLLACGDPSKREEREQGLPYRLILERFYGRLASAPMAPGMVTAVRRELSSGRCNLLHLHAPNPLGDLAGLAFARDLPLVLSWHSDIVRQRALYRLYAPIQRRVVERADRIVVFTPLHFQSSTQLKGLGVEHKLRVIPMGFDHSRLDAVHADPEVTASLERFAAGRPLLLTVGRHVYYKGYQHLLSALARMKEPTVVVMIGTGPLGESLRRQARELGIADRVLFMGEVGHAALVAAYHRCTVFTLPSVEPSEAFGMASAEAMACGKPTVVCRLGNGVDDLNQDGETSLLVPPRDEPALAHALDTLIRDGTLRTRLGAQARNRLAREFSLASMGLATAALYRELM